MARYRAPDGRSLEITPEGLTVLYGHAFFQDPPGGVTAHPQLFAQFLDALNRMLDAQMQRAEDDDTLSVDAQGRVIESVMLGQAVGHGLAAYARGTRGDLLELLYDLAATLTASSGLGAAVQHRLPAIGAAAGLDWLDGILLLPVERPHAVARLLDVVQTAGHAITPQEERRLGWAGYRRPAVLKDPLRPGWAVLAPPTTRIRDRLGRDQRLREIARHRDEGLRNVALLLLHVNGRDRLDDAPLVAVLDTALVLLLSMERPVDPAAAPVLETLQADHDGLHGELGRPNLPRSRQYRRAPGGTAAEHTWRARRLLRQLRVRRHSPPDVNLDALWDALNALDGHLEAGHDPGDDPQLKVTLLVLGLRGLVSTFRAPGMNMPPMVELAARVSGLDPLWAWEQTQPQGNRTVDLRQELGLLARSTVLAARAPTASQQQQDAWRVMRLAAGHLFATVRRAGIRLPEQAFLEAYYRSTGPLSALPLTAAALANLDTDIGELQTAQRSSAAQPPPPGESSAPEVPTAPTMAVAVPPASVPPPPPVISPHIAAARQRLQGRRVVLLGGVPSVPHREALVAALGLTELDWIGSSEYAHGTHAHARVTPDTAVVILAVRWMGHAHSTLRDVAREKQVPFVMHPGGLSPQSVAWQVMQQVSRQLDGADQAAGM